jgi:aminoglycoside phosphotransferase (APT) family kinase protein
MSESLHSRVASILGPAGSPDVGTDAGMDAGMDVGPDVGPLEPLAGGHSGLTYRVRAGDRALVVKAVPPGQRPIGRHDMVRQARILQALAGTGMPVPTVRAVDDRPPAWFAMDLVAGEALEPVLDDPPVEPGLAAVRMRRAAEVLPLLHAVALDRLPVDGEPLTPAAELARWARTMGAVPAELVPRAADLLRALETSIPEPVPPVLVHGDYRLGNILMAGTEPAALIDWEIWAPGDPRVELGWFLVFADGGNFPGVGRVVPGLPTEGDLVAAYRSGARGPALPEGMAWFNALGRFKMAAIMGHNLRRHREGRHHDPDQERLPATITRLLESGLERLARPGRAG